MKILIVKAFPGYIDVTNTSYNLQEIGLARAFNKAGHQCDVVYWGGKQKKIININYEENKTFQVFYLKALNVLKNGIYFGLTELAKEYDIVHCGGYDQIQSWMLAKAIPDKLIIYHGTYSSEFNVKYNMKCKVFDMFFLPRYLKYNTWFDTKSYLSEKFLRDKGLENVNSVGVGIDIEQLQAKKMISSELSMELQELRKNGKQIITYIGRIEPRRNMFFLLDVFKEILRNKVDVKLVVIGNGEKEYKQQFFDRVKELEIQDSLIYREKMKQELLPAVYSLSDVFLLPTKYEIFGMVLLEAMYFGVPVVTSLNGGSDILIKDRGNGVIVEAFEKCKWVNEIMKLLNDYKLRENISKNAQKFIAACFTWDALAVKFIEIFEDKLSEI